MGGVGNFNLIAQTVEFIVENKIFNLIIEFCDDPLRVIVGINAKNYKLWSKGFI